LRPVPVGPEADRQGRGAGFGGSPPRIDGFIVTAGYANGVTSLDQSGAGMLNSAGSPTVRTCSFHANWAQSYGGGMENWDAGPFIEGCLLGASSTATRT
jgi:hypothetical protein